MQGSSEEGEGASQENREGADWSVPGCGGQCLSPSRGIFFAAGGCSAGSFAKSRWSDYLRLSAPRWVVQGDEDACSE